MTMSKSDRKVKWRNVSITPDNVDSYLQDLYDDTKAQYINQGVSFNKDDPYQMGLLRLTLLEPQAFSGLCKQLLAHYFKNKVVVAQEMGIVNIPPAHIKPSQNNTVVSETLTQNSAHINAQPSPPSPPAHTPQNTPAPTTRQSISRSPRGGQNGKLSGLME